MTTLNIVTIVTLLAGAAWTVPTLIRRRFHDPMRVHLFLALLLMGLGNLLSQTYFLVPVDRVTFTGFSKIAYNILILSGLCLMVGFLRQVPLNHWRPPWPWEVVGCGVCLLGMVVATAMIPPELRNHNLASEYLSDWRVRTFYNLGNLYMSFSYAACALLARRRIKKGYSLRKLSLTLISAGLAGLAVSCVFRILWVNLPALRASGQPINYVHGFVLGQVSAILVCVGVGVPWIISMVQVVQEHFVCHKQYRELSDLWHGLMAVYPELVLDECRKSEYRWFARATDVYRRYVECRDGLTRLGPYLGALVGDKQDAAAIHTPREAARLIERAISMAAVRAEDVQLPKEQILFFAPRPGQISDDYETDLDTLIEISREIKAKDGRERRDAKLEMT